MTHARLTRRVSAGFTLQAEFAMPAGVTALVGPAGAGKSLALELIAGFARPDAGRVLIDDAIVFDGETRVNLPPRRRRAAHVASRDTLFPHMTVRENLMFAAARRARLERHKRVAGIMEQFALEETAGSRTAARIARAILSEPRLLLIDECGVDEPLLRRTMSAFPGPILLVTRDLDLCHACAEEMVLLEAGRVVQRGAAREVLDAPESAAAAGLLGFDNVFAATIAALDPGRDTSRLECEHFAFTGPYLPGHFNGDRVQVAVRSGVLRVHSGEIAAGVNFVALPLAAVSERLRGARLSFAHGVVAEVPRGEWERQRDNKSWQVEFPPAALRIF